MIPVTSRLRMMPLGDENGFMRVLWGASDANEVREFNERHDQLKYNRRQRHPV